MSAPSSNSLNSEHPLGQQATFSEPIVWNLNLRLYLHGAFLLTRNVRLARSGDTRSNMGLGRYKGLGREYE